MVINANTKTATKVLMVSFVEAKYGRISQLSRRKNGSFISEHPARTLRGEPEQSVMINPGWSAEARNSVSASARPALAPFRLDTRHFKTGCAWL